MYEEEARRGALLLDEHYPGWAGKISQEDLVMNSCDRCILGQLYRDYGVGLKRLCASGAVFQANTHGFSVEGITCGDRAPWEALADAWRAEIRARLTERE